MLCISTETIWVFRLIYAGLSGFCSIRSWETFSALIFSTSLPRTSTSFESLTTSGCFGPDLPFMAANWPVNAFRRLTFSIEASDSSTCCCNSCISFFSFFISGCFSERVLWRLISCKRRYLRRSPGCIIALPSSVTMGLKGSTLAIWPSRRIFLSLREFICISIWSTSLLSCVMACRLRALYSGSSPIWAFLNSLILFSIASICPLSASDSCCKKIVVFEALCSLDFKFCSR